MKLPIPKLGETVVTHLINNMTNHELITTSEVNGYCVDKTIVKELCTRLENLTSEVTMFRTLSDNTIAANKKQIAELNAEILAFAEMMGDEI